MLATQLKYDLLMFSRELFYVVFTLIVPPATYLFMGSLFGDSTYAGNLNYAQSYTPSFILLITFGVVFFAFGFDQVTHRTTGVEKRIALAPVPKRVLLTSAILKSILLTSFGYLLISVIGLLVYGLTFRFADVIVSFLLFMGLNAVLLLLSSAVFSFFKTLNSALVFAIVAFQIVLITGGFAIPVSMMPNFVQLIANANPLYHMNQLFIAAWNGQLEFSSTTALSAVYIIALLLLSAIVIRFQNRRQHFM